MYPGVTDSLAPRGSAKVNGSCAASNQGNRTREETDELSTRSLNRHTPRGPKPLPAHRRLITRAAYRLPGSLLALAALTSTIGASIGGPVACEVIQPRSPRAIASR